MASKSQARVKAEGTEIQSYLESFNKEIDDGDKEVIPLEMEEEEDDEEEEGGCYFVDQSGNYYYQASKDSEPVLTTAPPDAEIEGDEEGSESAATENCKLEPKSEDVSYVFIVQQNEAKDDGDAAADGEEDEHVYDFEEGDYGLTDQKPNVSKMKTQSLGRVTHMCNYCNYTTTKRFLLARHMKSHSDDRPHKCSVCERGFKTLASLQNHVNTHTGTKPHHCKHCESSFTTSGELVRHVRYRHTHEKPHKCPECDYASVELSKLKRHIRCHTGERPYQCPHCTYASPDTFKLKRHLRIHTGEKPYECDVCHARFTQSNSLKAHKMIHQVGDKPVFHCELCPTTCGRKTDLRIHVQKLHTPLDKPMRCRRCSKIYQDRYSYKMHTKTHEGEKCYKCDLCPYASISARHLESHLLVHTDQKPFQCDSCDQSFRQKQLLRRHVNLYHNPDYIVPAPKAKTHKCPSCPRSFRHKGNLIRHMALHDPESSAREQQQALKEGRQKRVRIRLEHEDENDEDEVNEQSVMTVEGEDGQYVVLEVIQLQDEDEQNSKKKRTSGNKHIDEEAEEQTETESESEEDIDLPENNDEFIFNETDVLMSTLEPKAQKTRYSTRNIKKMKSEEDMSNCFGFDEDDENSTDDKATITLLS
ncbi:transcriptional repressor CTCF-like [Wyeomyia smithii]|uniref:transcriptional repressor CTCF-like n=1 Tax=Wyeomyia smithii TaxID=174621 RepID=UPI002467BAAD|nr:transcriptional repressor CTCF-like [Wyeomyia smithii]XP_055535531.1 transcriptional repressor CTCF-like [Wyeomyia smithii]XP_055535532.1 transcriptional repressor CTCF-like [Wyeomyia smithii]XP_055535533.1 transcriptional repressor CTCF-like [Wyeomyia smithii]